MVHELPRNHRLERKKDWERERMRDNGKKRICYIYCNIGSNEVFFIFTCTGRYRYILFLVGNLCMWYGIFRILGIRIMLWNVAFRNQGWYIWNQGLYVCNLQVMLFWASIYNENFLYIGYQDNAVECGIQESGLIYLKSGLVRL